MEGVFCLERFGQNVLKFPYAERAIFNLQSTDLEGRKYERNILLSYGTDRVGLSRKKRWFL